MLAAPMKAGDAEERQVADGARGPVGGCSEKHRQE
jgi:hypothetical protein